MASSADTPTARTPLLKDNVEEDIIEVTSGNGDDYDDFDSEFSDPVLRKGIERELLWKLDKRMSILVLIYVLNFVSLLTTQWPISIV